ncbi:MAG: 30S ribosomal protein S8e [Candidatus Bathyarchaeia archaeon]
MPQWHGDLHKRKKTGGKKKLYREKRAYEMGGDPAETKIGERKISIKKSRGGNFKIILLACATANVTDPLTGKTQKTEIKRVVKNPASVDYQRRGVITKGSIIETPLGLAKVTSRPGQSGIVNAVLIQKA